MKAIIFSIITLALLGCKSQVEKPNKLVDTGRFEIEVPHNWKFTPLQGMDSFVGKFTANKLYLDFDCSEMGYANSIVPNDDPDYQIQNEKVGRYQRKLVRPLPGKKGSTGVYFSDSKSTFNFNLVGRDLSPENQELAIKAFKTIKFKRD